MSYGKTSNQEYRRNLKQAWGAGMTRALSQIDNLRKEGWVFDVNRGAMTKKQADYFMQVADRMGNETISIPVTDSANPVLFVGYKPAKRVRAQQVTARPKKEPIATDPIKEWENIYYKKNPEDMKEAEGSIMDPARVMAVLRPGATNQNLAGILKKSVDQPFKSVALQYSKITAAEKAAKNAGEKLKYIQFAKDSNYTVQNVKNAIKALGFSRAKQGPTAYLSAEAQPLAIVDDTSGWSVLIAPMIEVSIDEPSELATIETINQ